MASALDDNSLSSDQDTIPRHLCQQIIEKKNVRKMCSSLYH